MAKPHANQQQSRRPMTVDGYSSADSKLQAYADLARLGRAAALRVLTGRVAHQMRNPMAAIQAACKSLHLELQEPDHLERLDLMLHEITHVLSLVSSEIQAVARDPELPQRVDVAKEAADVVAIVTAAHPGAGAVTFRGDDDAACMASRDDLRVAVHSLLEHAIHSANVESTAVRVCSDDKRVYIEFAFVHTHDDAHKAVFNRPLVDSRITPDHLGHLIAERFARDVGGKLTERATENAQLLTMELPCDHV